MYGMRGARSSKRDEAEKPFWISYADLMTALMVLFLVVMAVALLAVTRSASTRVAAEEQHRKDIEEMLTRFESVASEARFSGITVDRERRVVDFGSRAQFPFGRSTLTGEQEQLLRAFVPAVLEKTNDVLGQKVLKEIVVDGFTDRTGSYLSNLNLSLQRSQRVLCALFSRSAPDEKTMTEQELEQLRAMFVVGGYSFNAAKETAEQSRRVEMRLQFLALGENRKPSLNIEPGNFGTCSLGR